MLTITPDAVLAAYDAVGLPPSRYVWSDSEELNCGCPMLVFAFAQNPHLHNWARRVYQAYRETCWEAPLTYEQHPDDPEGFHIESFDLVNENPARIVGLIVREELSRTYGNKYIDGVLDGIDGYQGRLRNDQPGEYKTGFAHGEQIWIAVEPRLVANNATNH